MGLPRDIAEVEKNFSEAIPALESGLRKARADQVFYMMAMFLCAMALGITGGLDMPWGLGVVQTIMRVILTLGLGFCVWMAAVITSAEMNAIRATKKDISNLLRANTLVKG